MAKTTYDQAKKDYMYLASIDDADDFCGAFCNTELFLELLANPTKNKAKKLYMDLIEHYLYSGFELNKMNLIASDDPVIMGIRERYL